MENEVLALPGGESRLPEEPSSGSEGSETVRAPARLEPEARPADPALRQLEEKS